MENLFARIKTLVYDNRYIVGQHASERLDERGIMEWQAVVGLQQGVLLAERPNSLPNPSVEVREELPNGEEFKAVWSLIQSIGVAKLVTVHFFDEF